MFRTPFERDAPPILNGSKNKNDNNPEYETRQRQLTNLLLSPRSTTTTGVESQQQQQQRSISTMSASTNGAAASQQQPSPRAMNGNNNNNNNNNNKIDRVASHLSSDKVVKAGRCLAPLSGPTLVIVKDMTAVKKRQLLQLLLKACVVSDSQCERIFGWANPREYLGPRALPPLSFISSNATSFSAASQELSFFESSVNVNNNNNGENENSFLTEEQQQQKRELLSREIPPVLLEANGTPSWLIKQPAGSEARITGIAKILYYLTHCALPEHADGAAWVTNSNTVDLPEFLRHFGDAQRTVIQFRSQRQREDKGAQAIVDALMKGGSRSVSGSSQRPVTTNNVVDVNSNENSFIVG